MGEVADELEALRHIYLEDELEIHQDGGVYTLGMRLRPSWAKNLGSCPSYRHSGTGECVASHPLVITEGKCKRSYVFHTSCAHTMAVL
jgi:hypothetical protein